MTEFYAIYSSRGIWVEVVKKGKTGTKRLILGGKAETEKRALELSREHKRKYWAQAVSIKE